MNVRRTYEVWLQVARLGDGRTYDGQTDDGRTRQAVVNPALLTDLVHAVAAKRCKQTSVVSVTEPVPQRGGNWAPSPTCKRSPTLWMKGLRVGWSLVRTQRPRSRSEGAIRATLTRTPSASSLLDTRSAVLPPEENKGSFKGYLRFKAFAVRRPLAEGRRRGENRPQQAACQSMTSYDQSREFRPPESVRLRLFFEGMANSGPLRWILNSKPALNTQVPAIIARPRQGHVTGDVESRGKNHIRWNYRMNVCNSIAHTAGVHCRATPLTTKDAPKWATNCPDQMNTLKVLREELVFVRGVGKFRKGVEKDFVGVTTETLARLALRSDEALGVRVTVARIAPSLLDPGRAASPLEDRQWLTAVWCDLEKLKTVVRPPGDVTRTNPLWLVKNRGRLTHRSRQVQGTTLRRGPRRHVELAVGTTNLAINFPAHSTRHHLPQPNPLPPSKLGRNESRGGPINTLPSRGSLYGWRPQQFLGDCTAWFLTREAPRGAVRNGTRSNGTHDARSIITSRFPYDGRASRASNKQRVCRANIRVRPQCSPLGRAPDSGTAVAQWVEHPIVEPRAKQRVKVSCLLGQAACRRVGYHALIGERRSDMMLLARGAGGRGMSYWFTYVKAFHDKDVVSFCALSLTFSGADRANFITVEFHWGNAQPFLETAPTAGAVFPATFGMIPTCESPGGGGARIEPSSPWWEESSLTTTPPRPPSQNRAWQKWPFLLTP
ncbi:hypothetical protein PR048_026267 [Dryococelus australis]|uniref:Uncharacterized protein n=1 Tax=Dryococelus australis TaxID=614101 RepID=A0ABQ9GKV0_9NEOP|nr:hypothetical protein PR048_026267 [Dryococelus australis]